MHLAWISFLQEWDLEGAYRHLHKAFEIRPFVDFYQSMASILVAERKFDAALDHIETAIKLDPFSEINYHLKGFILYAREEYSEAIEQFEKCVSLKPDSQVSLQYWGQALLLQGHAKEALAFFQNLSDETDYLLKLGGTTLAHTALGNRHEVQQGIAVLESAMNGELMDRALNLLILCKTAVGAHEEALQLIEKGIENRLPMMVYLAIEPTIAPLRAMPRFQELMENIL
jgi:tetratricopeptide (TPR) repeat protein